MATDESGGARAKGLAGVSQAVVLSIVGVIRSLYERSAPWIMMVRTKIMSELHVGKLQLN